MNWWSIHLLLPLLIYRTSPRCWFICFLLLSSLFYTFSKYVSKKCFFSSDSAWWFRLPKGASRTVYQTAYFNFSDTKSTPHSISSPAMRTVFLAFNLLRCASKWLRKWNDIYCSTAKTHVSTGAQYLLQNIFIPCISVSPTRPLSPDGCWAWNIDYRRLFPRLVNL